MPESIKTVHIHYYAALREERGLSEESVTTGAVTAADLFTELTDRHEFSLGADEMRVVVNAQLRNWSSAIREGDTVVFLPPVAGG